MSSLLFLYLINCMYSMYSVLPIYAPRRKFDLKKSGLNFVRTSSSFTVLKNLEGTEKFFLAIKTIMSQTFVSKNFILGWNGGLKKNELFLKAGSFLLGKCGGSCGREWVIDLTNTSSDLVGIWAIFLSSFVLFLLGAPTLKFLLQWHLLQSKVRRLLEPTLQKIRPSSQSCDIKDVLFWVV